MLTRTTSLLVLAASHVLAASTAVDADEPTVRPSRTLVHAGSPIDGVSASMKDDRD